MLNLGAAGTIPTWDIRDRLRKARETAGLEQSELATVMGVSRQTVSNYEKGHVQPRRSGLRLWAMATGVPVEWIETGCTPSDLNREPTDSGWGALATVVDIDSARSLRAPAVPLDAA